MVVVVVVVEVDLVAGSVVVEVVALVDAVVEWADLGAVLAV